MITEPTNKQEWKIHLEKFDVWNERLLFAYLATFGRPPSILDIGCGTGAMVKLARLNGIEAVGIDQLEMEPPDITHDLEKPIDLGKKYGLVICLEVVEHISEFNEDIILRTIQNHAHKNGMLLFSAAHPGQGGDHHKNLRSAKYWRSMLFHRGMNYREDITNRMRIAWLNIPHPMDWLISNVQLFDCN
jgi:cyclopropane fatty-acyl-phospholipid synthase-like methyltransferase